MPRTKLDKHCIGKAELETRVIKSAMGRAGVYTNKALAEKIGADAASLSRGFKTGFTDNMKKRMHKVLRFTPEEIQVLGGWSA